MRMTREMTGEGWRCSSRSPFLPPAHLGFPLWIFLLTNLYTLHGHGAIGFSCLGCKPARLPNRWENVIVGGAGSFDGLGLFSD